MNWILSSQQSWLVRKGAEIITSVVRRDHFFKAIGGRRVRGFQQASGKVLGVSKGEPQGTANCKISEGMKDCEDCLPPLSDC